ncbi:MAG TPA: DUF1080 domain-containing protein [Planctomycetota bacterium]
MLSLLVALAQSEPGFTSLFDGRTLAGWTERGGRYDGDADWRVEEGCIVGRQGPGGEGGLLYTEKSYTSFELRLEVWLDHPFDSGVFLRMLPPATGLKGAQVTLDWREGGEIGAIYADGFLLHNQEGAQRFRRDAWNDLRVRCTGFDMQIEVELNGQPLTRFEQPSDAPGFAPAGRIGLQVHGERGDTGAARFRSVRIRELPVFADDFRGEPDTPPDARLASAAAERGWRALFDGRSLAGWSVDGPAERFRARDGVLDFLAQGGGGHLATVEDFQDFALRLDFRTARMANSGLFLRAARDGSNAAFSGCELQILDDFSWESVTGTKLKPWQFTGSLYGAVANPQRDALRPLGAWNTYEVLYRGSRLAVALNGRTLYDVDTHALVPEQGEPFAKRATTGFIGLQHHGAELPSEEAMVSFRNVFVRRL